MTTTASLEAITCRHFWRKTDHNSTTMTNDGHRHRPTASEDTISRVVDQLKRLVIDDKKCISYTFVSLQFGLHVEEAIGALNRLAEQQDSDGHHLCLNYVLSGNNDDPEDQTETKMERFMIVKEQELESAAEWFKSGYDKHLYSVSLSEDVSDQIPLGFDEVDVEVKDSHDLDRIQSLTYTKNPKISFRNIRRRVAIKPVVQTEAEDSKNKTEKENDSKSRPKPKTNSAKGRNRKNKISNMFSKSKKDLKVEYEGPEGDVDPFKSDSEDEDKPKAVFDDTEADKEIEDVKPKDNRKRTSKKDSSSDEEEIVSSKKKNKKFRRIRLISESDSEGEEVESKQKPIEKFTSEKPKKPFTKIESRQESHVDEDGYVVTRTVKTEVEVNGKSKPDAEDKPRKKTSEGVRRKDSAKEEDNQKSNGEPKPEKKPEKKAPAKAVAKNQSSITSFFKPKAST